jgi:hypothetical protein
MGKSGVVSRMDLVCDQSPLKVGAKMGGAE